MTALSGAIQSAPDGARGFDTTEVLSLATAQLFKADGFDFCIRYLSLLSTDQEAASGDLTLDEANTILDAGLALMAVQHVRNPGFVPDAAMGIQTGNHAANNALFAGLPPEVNIWLDLEGVAAGAPVSDVIAYCNRWFDQVASVGYVPGIYVGYDSLLTSDQLFHALKFEHYWQSPSNVPDVAIRGYQMLQPEIDKVVYGINIDLDQTQTDHLGGAAMWLTR